MGISDNIWEGLIFHQKDWDCLQSEALGCFLLACNSFPASSHSLAPILSLRDSLSFRLLFDTNLYDLQPV